MNTQIGKSIGIALLLAAGLLAALFAMGVFTATGVGATSHVCMEVGETKCSQLKQNFTVNGTVINLQTNEYDYGFEVEQQTSTLNLVDVQGETGTLTEILPVDADEDTDGHQVDLTGNVVKAFTIEVRDDPAVISDTGPNTTYTVTLGYESPTNSTTAGATVRLTLKVLLVAAVDDDIVINMSNFGVPPSIDTDDITISNDGNTANPTDVSSESGKITLVVPDMNGSSALEPGLIDTKKVSGASTKMPTTIRISNKAGITNPMNAGLHGITIDAKDAIDGTGNDAQNVAKVVTSVAIDPKKGSSKADVTVTGKGFSTGSATVFIDKTPDKVATTDVDEESYTANDVYDRGVDVVIAEGVDITDGTFTATIAGIAKPADDLSVTISAFDGAGILAETTAKYTFGPSVSVSPASISWGETLTLTISDYSGTPKQVRFGGNNELLASVLSGATPKEAKVVVPANVQVGKQKVEILDSSGVVSGLSTTVGIVPLSVTISPSAVVPGQQVTIDGGGYEELGEGEKVTIEIGGASVTVPTDARVTTSNRVRVTVQVPLDVGTGTKKVKVTAGSRIGEGEIDVAKPSITVDPAESPGGSTVRVTGTGFGAGQRVEVLYDNEIEGVGQADNSGNVALDLVIPTDAGIGVSRKVTVEVRKEDSITASANHSTPDAEITVAPQEVAAGEKITISGTNLQRISILQSVTIGGENAIPSPAPLTGRDGSVEFGVAVPGGLRTGTHTVVIEDGGQNIASTTFTVIPEGPAPAVTDPAKVFAELGDRLVRVWYLNSATQIWSFYDPDPEVVAFDINMTEVNSGQIVTVIISAGDTVEFQGAILYAGTNNVALD